MADSMKNNINDDYDSYVATTSDVGHLTNLLPSIFQGTMSRIWSFVSVSNEGEMVHNEQRGHSIAEEQIDQEEAGEDDSLHLPGHFMETVPVTIAPDEPALIQDTLAAEHASVALSEATTLVEATFVEEHNTLDDFDPILEPTTFRHTTFSTTSTLVESRPVSQSAPPLWLHRRPLGSKVCGDDDYRLPPPPPSRRSEMSRTTQRLPRKVPTFIGHEERYASSLWLYRKPKEIRHRPRVPIIARLS
ncbi:hypothetical protein VNI00_010518 [Paramarasmius palmivorus]|uniref:Uncharacterized protein n=1 Tax=Paramarasmius palmivorus TaxID=297713 RepID=A0AAW0CM75_9AGAR